MPKTRKYLCLNSMVQEIHDCFSKVPDHRPDNSEGKITLLDTLMSGFDMMHLKYPAVLEFDKDRKTPELKHNLNSLYLGRPAVSVGIIVGGTFRLNPVFSEKVRAVLSPVFRTHLVSRYEMSVFRKSGACQGKSGIEQMMCLKLGNLFLKKGSNHQLALLICMGSPAFYCFRVSESQCGQGQTGCWSK